MDANGGYGDDIENLIVFYKEGTIEDLEVFKSIALLNEKNIIIRNNDGIDAFPIEKIPDFVFNKDTFNKFVDTLTKVAKVFPYLIVIASFVFSFFMISVSRIIYSGFAGLVLFVVAKVMDTKIKYDQAVRIIVHGMTVPFIINVLLVVFGVLNTIPGWFFILNFIMAILAILEIKKGVAPSKEKSKKKA